MLVAIVAGDIVVAQSEVNYLENSGVGVDEDVVGLDVAVHDAVGVEIVEALGKGGGTLKSWAM